MNTYTEPPTSDLPRLACSAICQSRGITSYQFYNEIDKAVWYWCPHTCHDDAQLLINEAFFNGFGLQLATILCEPHHGKMFYKILLQATPEEKTRAYLRAYHESKTWPTPPPNSTT